MAWIEQDDMTLRIQGAEGDATVEELTAMGLTEDAVHPQTCTTCHDPHKQGTTSGEPNTATVRISGDTKMLPAGFKATGVGHGALCISCHNTRNGAHNDTVGDPTSFSAPHVAAQGDVLMGQNAYFVTAGQRGAHSYINNTCTNCHMVATPPPALLSYNQTGTNHSFTADMSICGNCHGDFDGGTLQAATSASLADLAAAIAAAAEEVLSGTETIHVRAYDAATDLYSSAAAADANVVLDLTANPLTHVEVTEGHGQGELHLTLTSPISIAWSDGTSTTTDSFGVQLQSFYADDGLGAQGVQVFSLTGNMVRAVWNLLLLEGDGSLGVHNGVHSVNLLDTARIWIREELLK